MTTYYPTTRQCIACHRVFTSFAPQFMRCGPCQAVRRDRVVDFAIAVTIFGCITLLVLALLSSITQTPHTWIFP